MRSEKSPSKTACLPNGNEPLNKLSRLTWELALLSAARRVLTNPIMKDGNSESEKSKPA